MKFIILDLETTGHSALDQIIEVGLVVVSESLEIIESYGTFVKPSIEIPSFISQLTGITEQDVQDAPSIQEVLLSIIPKFEDAVLVAHNVGFDAGFLNQALDQNGYMPFSGRKLDTMELVRILYPQITSYQLGFISQALDITHDHHHRAESDALATAHIFAKAVQKLRDLPLLTLQRLSSLFTDDRDIKWLLQTTEQYIIEHSVLEPVEYDYYRQFALKAKPWGDEASAREQKDANAYFEQNKSFEQYLADVKQAFEQKFENYEERPPQTQMFHEIYDALTKDSHLLIEAGTGTGKSLGYLIPALYYGIKAEKKVVVSTHTINLQEQLKQRDVPLLEEILPFPFKASTLKGRGNYLCMRKFENKLNILDFVAPVDDPITAAQMTIWLSETESGDQEELNLGPKGQDFWGTVASDADSCLNRACPWFKRCYYHRAKHQSNISDVCITNHAMVFTDIQAEHRLLPTYSNLILDEAHHLEEVASKHLGNQIAYFTYLYTFNTLFKDLRTGLLPSLRVKVQEDGDDHTASWNEIIDTTYPSLQNLKEQWDHLFERLYQMVIDEATNEQLNDPTGNIVLRIDKNKLPKNWVETLEVESNIGTEISRITKSLDKMATDMKERLDDDLTLNGLLTDLNGALRDLIRIKDELKQFLKLELEDYVYWIEASTQFKYRSLQLASSPVDVSGLLKKYLFDVKDSVIMTSATLSIQKSFNYIEENIGLSSYYDEGRMKSVMLDSPFNYREQALVIIPRDFPVLKGSNVDESYLNKLVQSLTNMAVVTNGRMLVLFTSYRMLKQVYDELKASLVLHQISVFGQGIDSSNRTKLTRRFLQADKAILLGTSSFWEGVDIPGDALTCLAIVRLPFQPPNHPLVEAKSELLVKQKKNPFMKLSIPQAVIKFKQGFGRLVRTAQDKGIVIIYDTRVIESYYGKNFLYSLPGPKIETMFDEQMIQRAQQWLEEDLYETN